MVNGIVLGCGLSGRGLEREGCGMRRWKGRCAVELWATDLSARSGVHQMVEATEGSCGAVRAPLLYRLYMRFRTLVPASYTFRAPHPPALSTNGSCTRRSCTRQTLHPTQPGRAAASYPSALVPTPPHSNPRTLSCPNHPPAGSLTMPPNTSSSVAAISSTGRSPSSAKCQAKR